MGETHSYTGHSKEGMAWLPKYTHISSVHHGSFFVYFPLDQSFLILVQRL